MPTSRVTAVAILVAVLGCHETPRSVSAARDGSVDADQGQAASASVAAAPPRGPGLVATRPYTLKVPKGYDAAKPTPLVVLLHGYTSNGANQEAYFGFSPVADAKTFLLAYPDGTKNSRGDRFWNANDACCNFDGSSVDDVAYLEALIDDVSARYHVDARRIYVVGHSNGAFMAHRLACDLAPKIAAIVALAGAVWFDPARCSPAAPVAVLQVHGDADRVIPYEGGRYGLGRFPSARASVATWASKNGCTGSLETAGPRLDLDALVPGAETSVERYACSAGAAELWTIHGGSHVPRFQPTWAEAVWDFLAAHPRP